MSETETLRIEQKFTGRSFYYGNYRVYYIRIKTYTQLFIKSYQTGIITSLPLTNVCLIIMKYAW